MTESVEVEPFTIEEKVYAVAWSLSHNNREESRRMFQQKYGKEPPSANHIKFWSKKLLETGSLVQRRSSSGRPCTASSEENKENIVKHFKENPSTSIRSVASSLNISKSSVGRILQQENFHPFEPSYCQFLYDGDEDRRLQFCETMVELCDNYPAFLRELVFSDECHFELHGAVNKHNIHFWDQQNPHEIIRTPVKTRSLTVWMAISFHGVVAFDISPQTMNSERYCSILNEKVIPYMSSNNRKTWYYQQDGAPPHFSIEARRILNNFLPGRWIGRRGAIEWPPRSPDLTPADFWLWSYLKSKVFVPPGRTFHSLDEMREKIEEQIPLIPLSMFRDSFKDFRKRVDKCIDKAGAYFEHCI